MAFGELGVAANGCGVFGGDLNFPHSDSQQTPIKNRWRAIRNNFGSADEALSSYQLSV
jgi:hypothetical protein